MLNSTECLNVFLFFGRGGGQMVIVLAFYSYGSKSNSTEVYICKIVWKERKNRKEPGMAHLKIILFTSMSF